MLIDLNIYKWIVEFESEGKFCFWTTDGNKFNLEIKINYCDPHTRFKNLYVWK